MKFDGGSGRPLLFKRVVLRFLDSPREQEKCAPMRGALSISPGDNRGFVCAPMRGALSISSGDNRGFNARPCAGVHGFGNVARKVHQGRLIYSQH
jgi:hypothetical protein